MYKRQNDYCSDEICLNQKKDEVDPSFQAKKELFEKLNQLQSKYDKLKELSDESFAMHQESNERYEKQIQGLFWFSKIFLDFLTVNFKIQFFYFVFNN